MSRELLILRHGKSDWGTDASSDFERPLAKRGRSAVRRIANWLSEQALLPDLIVSSTAKRARQTANRLCAATGLRKESVVWEEEIYMADVATLLAVLSRCPPLAGRVMIIGHNPGFEELVLYLAARDPARARSAKLMPTAALAHVRMPDEWDALGPGCARVLSITRPRELG